MNDIDVVIVGAGAAGVGAGMTCAERGVSFVMVEAMDRIGGRAYTDKTSLPHHWDQGCHWLHCADQNPLVAHADRVGATYITEEREDWFGVWRNGRWGDEADRAKALEAVWSPLVTLSDKGVVPKDVSLAEFLPRNDGWSRLRDHWVQLMASGDPEQVSALGYSDYADTEVNWPVASGYGDLIERMAVELPVRTGVDVRGIEQLGDRVRVVTSHGVIDAKAAIVTVSTAVLNAGKITFSSGPANDLLELVQDVPCGYYEKIAVAVEDGTFAEFETPGGTIVPDDGEIINFQISPYWEGLVVGHVAGTPARELAALGEAAMIDFAHERLVLAFGSDIRRKFIKSAATAWKDNPFVQGGYSFARPGAAHKRHAMIAADTGNVAFAGEAFSLQWEATAHGAWQSGRDVAGRILGGLCT